MLAFGLAGFFEGGTLVKFFFGVAVGRFRAADDGGPILPLLLESRFAARMLFKAISCAQSRLLDLLLKERRRCWGLATAKGSVLNPKNIEVNGSKKLMTRPSRGVLALRWGTGRAVSCLGTVGEQLTPLPPKI